MNTKRASSNKCILLILSSNKVILTRNEISIYRGFSDSSPSDDATTSDREWGVEGGVWRTTFIATTTKMIDVFTNCHMRSYKSVRANIRVVLMAILF